ncbi:hypothetical protein DSM104329_00915 [Capillimicrobium parvum]|uniref:Uncharacterized protein n=1 Tax=Capillimicrobium parvum TaxID=2884022 RepID=A0A9E6XVH6_9ACTN|nr:hypothetical protein DSM104329_00915 [Capillimicrobium parvum]
MSDSAKVGEIVALLQERADRGDSIVETVKAVGDVVGVDVR